MRAFPFICCLLAGVALLPPPGWTHDDDDDDKPARAVPAGALVLDAASGKPAVGSLPVDFVRSPDALGPGGGGRFLVAVNSGYGVQFDARSNRGQQSLAIIDLNATPAPVVVQHVYFPSPQSANVGAAFGVPGVDGAADLFVSGGFQNKLWRFRFSPAGRPPLTPPSPGPDTTVDAPSIDLTPLSPTPPTRRYNAGKAAVYPAGVAVLGGRIFVANDLDDSLGVVEDLDRPAPTLRRVDLRPSPLENVYPYAVACRPALPPAAPDAVKVYVSLWNRAAVAVVAWPPAVPPVPPTLIPTGSHPTAMVMDAERARLFVVNANDDSVSVIDTGGDREIERIDVRLSADELPGVSPEALALSPDGTTLYVANARADAVAVVRLGDAARGAKPVEGRAAQGSRVAGLIPTGRYPSALALVGNTLFVGNGKGTGTANSSDLADLSNRNPNAPNAAFPPNGRGHHEGRGGAYSVAVTSGDFSAVPLPDDGTLARWTAQCLRTHGLAGGAEKKPAPFARRAGGSPIRHVIYIIKENRTYDQVFGDLARSGDGSPADGDPALAIFGAGEAAARPGEPPQDVTPNQHALALRFGLLDRFFVNSEASADGHNWSTAAFSTDYVDKVFRWNYSGRGRSYDFEGFNRLPDTGQTGGEPLLPADVSAQTMADFLRRYLPYTHGATDAGEPATLYLWDLAARAGRSYRTYGEFVGTASADDLAAARANHAKTYPDVSPTLVAVPAKASLEGHVCAAARGFDLDTPDAFTTDSYRAALAAAAADAAPPDPLISAANADARFRGVSRVGAWLEEFAQAQAAVAAGKADPLPALSIVRVSNDHTAGMSAGKPSPQFFVADNDYAVGRLVEAVSRSVYWKDTAIITVEDDAQDGPDHVDCHRSVALVISAYNRPGALVHSFVSTAGLVRTLEALLGLPPMNAQDAAAATVDVFRDGPPDLTPFTAKLPQLALAGIMTPAAPEAATEKEASAIRRSGTLDLSHPDASDAGQMNAAIWFSVKQDAALPAARHLPLYDLRRGGFSVTGSVRDDDDDD